MKKIAYLLTGAFMIASCAGQDDGKPVDQNATPETVNLYRNLFLIAEKGFMFGHEDDLAYGVGWWAEEGRSDVKETAGSYPAVYGWDLGDIGAERNLDSVLFDDMVRWIREVYERGGINTISWHLDNPVSGGSSWDKTPAVKAILPGGEKHAEYLRSLNLVADFFDKLRSGDKKIPIVFRPFHEHNGDWFWWGKGNCEESDYIELWKFTAGYLKNERKINHLLYAFSPDRSRMDLSTGQASYFWGYPGDEYVDIIGLDNYWDVGSTYNKKTVEESKPELVQSLEMISEIAREKNKPAALTETGNEALTIDQWYTKVLLQPVKENRERIRIGWALVWRNARPDHMYAPHPGHPSAADFLEFRNDPIVFFEDDIEGIYAGKVKIIKQEERPASAAQTE